MPGILALKQKAKSDQPLKGAKIVGCTHINAQSAVFIETLGMVSNKMSIGTFFGYKHFKQKFYKVNIFNIFRQIFH